jgi:hypothetical protein
MPRQGRGRRPPGPFRPTSGAAAGRFAARRIGDLDLVGGDILASGPGRAIGVHSMKGRSRVYLLADGGRPPLSVLSLAFNDRCDVVVATAVLGAPEPAAREDAVLEFVRSDLVLRWAETTLGL